MGYKQTFTMFMLLKMRVEMIENNTFQAKCPILAILENVTSRVQNVV